VYLSPGSSNCSLKVAKAVPVGAINGCGWASTRVSRVCSYRSLPPLFIRSTPPLWLGWRTGNGSRFSRKIKFNACFNKKNKVNRKNYERMCESQIWTRWPVVVGVGYFITHAYEFSNQNWPLQFQALDPQVNLHSPIQLLFLFFPVNWKILPSLNLNKLETSIQILKYSWWGAWTSWQVDDISAPHQLLPMFPSHGTLMRWRG
jgi:hypothetical protein